jgi:hypothetical protein
VRDDVSNWNQSPIKASKAIMKRRLRRTFLFLSLGLATTLVVAFLMALLVDIEQGRQNQAENYTDNMHWTVTRFDRAGAAQITSLRVDGSDLSWSPHQAAGPPDSPQMGDQHTAWASLGTSSPEWLILDYPSAVIPRRVDVYESYTPGALSKVTVFDSSGKEIEAWSGVDPTPKTATSGPTPVSKIPILLNVPTRRIKLYIASDKVPGWNEIDAVGLMSDQGQTQWATRVSASSTYARSYTVNSALNPADLVPHWSGLEQPTHAMQSGQINREERRIDARGWPLLALYSETLVPPAQSPGNATAPGAKSIESLIDLELVTPPGGSAYPMRSGLGGTSAITTPKGAAPVPVPFRPIWLGLFGDTVLYAAVWFVLWAVLVIPRRFVREVARFRRGTCIQCGYDLGYDFMSGCPECGWRRDEQTAPSTSRISVGHPLNGDD